MRLNNGDVIIFPTDTVYGIGAKITDSLGMDKIYEIKKRPKEKRLSVLCSDINDIYKIAYVTDAAKRLIECFMPGGLTIILNSKEEIRNDYIFETVAVRIPNHELAIRILRENGPMATTSVNTSGQTPMNDYIEIVKHFGNQVLNVYPNAINSSKVSSTIIDLTGEEPTLIREGKLKFNDIINFLNNK